MSTTRDRIREIVVANPSKYRQSDVAFLLGISRERVRQVVNVECLRDLVIPRERNKCSTCGRNLHNRKNRYCMPCYRDSRHVVFICEGCGIEHTTVKSQYVRAKFHFCSNRCKWDNIQKLRKRGQELAKSFEVIFYNGKSSGIQTK